MKVTNTMIFVTRGATRGWFCYGQGDSKVSCFADVYEDNDFAKNYPICFDINDCIVSDKIINEETYCVCYDDSRDGGQKSFRGDGLKVKEKLLSLYTRGRADCSWIFPMSKAIKTKDLEKEIRNNPISYKEVADWFGEENW